MTRSRRRDIALRRVLTFRGYGLAGRNVDCDFVVHLGGAVRSLVGIADDETMSTVFLLCTYYLHVSAGEPRLGPNTQQPHSQAALVPLSPTSSRRSLGGSSLAAPRPTIHPAYRASAQCPWRLQHRRRKAPMKPCSPQSHNTHRPPPHPHLVKAR